MKEQFFISNHRDRQETARKDIFIYDPISNVFYDVGEEDDPLALATEIGDLIEEAGSFNKLILVTGEQKLQIQQEGYEQDSDRNTSGQ